MDGELKTGEPSAIKRYSDKFRELFPSYIALGMTEEQYWDKDCTLVLDYRKAEELRKVRRNQELHLQGAYFYQALCCAAPILHAFAKKGTEPQPYPPEPFAMTKGQAERKEEEQAKAMFNKGKQLMERLMSSSNKKFEGGE